MLLKSIYFFQNMELQNRCAFDAQQNNQNLSEYIAEKVCLFIEQKWGKKMTPKNSSDFYITCRGYADIEKLPVAVFIERSCERMVMAQQKGKSWREKISNFLDLNHEVGKELVGEPS